MNTKNIIKYLVSALFVCLVTPAIAQQPENLNKEVQVTRAYDPIISDANKIDIQVVKSDSLTSIKKEFNYSVLARGISSTYAIRPIPAATISGQAYTDPQFLYVRLGMGYPFSPLGDIYINNYNPSSMSVGAFYNFRSMIGNIDNDNPKGHKVPIDETSHNAGAYFKKHFERFTLGVEGGFNRHQVLFYGYDAGINNFIDYKINKDSVSQAYTAFNVKLSTESNDKDAETLRYRAGIWFNGFGDNGKNYFDKGRMFAMQENTMGGELHLAKLFNSKHLFDLNIDFNYYNRKLNINPIFSLGNDTTDNRYRLVVLPSYKLANEKFELMLGVKLDLANERDSTKLHIRPQASFAYLLASEFVPYAGIEGGREVNSYEKIVRENPYILPGMNFDMVSTSHDYLVKVGVKGSIDKMFSYNIYGAYSLNKNMYFYYNYENPLYPNSQFSLYNNFNVALDEVQEMKVSAELAANFRNVKAMLKANYFNYKLNDVKAPFHRPEFTVNFNTDITIARYFILSARLYGQSRSAYGYYEPQNKVLYNDGFIDAGIGGEYLFNRSFSVFANVNNLLNTKYMMWNLYKVPGIHFEGGVTFKF